MIMTLRMTMMMKRMILPMVKYYVLVSFTLINSLCKQAKILAQFKNPDLGVCKV